VRLPPIKTSGQDYRLLRHPWYPIHIR